MHSLLLPRPSHLSPPFGQHEFDTAPAKLLLRAGQPGDAQGRCPRAPSKANSMSGSLPAGNPFKLPGEAEQSTVPHDSERATTLPETSQPATTLAQPALTATDSHAQPAAIGPTGEYAPQTFAYTGPASQVPQPESTQLLSQHVEPSLPPSRLPPSQADAATEALAPRPARRTKAHVASACVNCKKKHLGCDPGRPCRRCVLSGKAATCVDVTHKKRGRPPLKAEEASLRSYASPLESSAPSMEPSQANRPFLHRPTSSRELRPMTDLQAPNTGAALTPALPSQRWSASLPLPVDPSLSLPGNAPPRRFSASGAAHQVPPGFPPAAPGFNPALDTSRMPQSHPYAPPDAPLTSPPHFHHPFAPSTSPYLESSHAPAWPSLPDPSAPRTSRENYLPSPVRLPPILPTTNPASGSHAHRLSDPYPAVWSLVREDPTQERDRRPRQPSLGQIEPLSSYRQLHPIGSHDSIGSGSQSGPIAPRRESYPAQFPPRTEEKQPDAEADKEEARPAKRRKMALNDMVND